LIEVSDVEPKNILLHTELPVRGWYAGLGIVINDKNSLLCDDSLIITPLSWAVCSSNTIQNILFDAWIALSVMAYFLSKRL
jgi:hypothetical protein